MWLFFCQRFQLLFQYYAWKRSLNFQSVTDLQMAESKHETQDYEQNTNIKNADGHALVGFIGKYRSDMVRWLDTHKKFFVLKLNIRYCNIFQSKYVFVWFTVVLFIPHFNHDLQAGTNNGNVNICSWILAMSYIPIRTLT